MWSSKLCKLEIWSVDGHRTHSQVDACFSYVQECRVRPCLHTRVFRGKSVYVDVLDPTIHPIYIGFLLADYRKLLRNETTSLKFAT